jgi:probable HAF family extracellular repeat protein
MTGLGFLAGFESNSVAYAISADGAVVVGASADGLGQSLAFRWTGASGMVALGVLPGSNGSNALGVSADGAVVVGESFQPAGSSEAFVWTESNGMERLEDVLAANGVTGLAGWSLESARAISADGQWVVGSGINPAGEEEAFLADISPASSGGGGGGGALDGFSLLALGLMGALRRKISL